MKRHIYKDLIKWKNSPFRKPLVLNGARQVGKTWILKEFGKSAYENVAYLNCDQNPDLNEAFYDFNIDRLLRVFSAISHQTIHPETTLIILDEIQQIPLALTSLKYFSENAPQYHIVAAGSLLGIKTHSGTGFPVGKVDELTLFPMTFLEFLQAQGEGALLDIMRAHKYQELISLENHCIELLRQYYFTGGMPEIVDYYIQTNDIWGTRAMQSRILHDYENDFSKHVPAPIQAKVTMVWHSVPSQLAKENKKFVYSHIKKGARAKEFEDAIQWLIDAGLVFKVMRVNKIAKPLKFYEDLSAFKLFTLDVGLLNCMAETDPKDILLGESIFEEYQGAFTEQFIASITRSLGLIPYYYTKENATLEIDFLCQLGKVLPIEVKSGKNVRSKSLMTLLQKHPDLTGVRFSLKPYDMQEQFTNVPLYLAEAYLRDLMSHEGHV